MGVDQGTAYRRRNGVCVWRDDDADEGQPSAMEDTSLVRWSPELPKSPDGDTQRRAFVAESVSCPHGVQIRSRARVETQKLGSVKSLQSSEVMTPLPSPKLQWCSINDEVKLLDGRQRGKIGISKIWSTL